MEEMNNKILIKLENQFYYPGDTIKGNIYIDIENNIISPGLELIIKGKEILKANPEIYEEEDDNNIENTGNNKYDNLNQPYKYYDNIEIFKSNISITNEQEIKKGKYTFPFTTKLPNSIPGTCIIYDKNIYGEVYYYIKIKGLDSNRIKIKKAIPLIIRQNISDFKYKKSNSLTKTFPKFCCCKKGNGKLNLEITNDYFLIGEKLKININVDNREGKLEGGPISIYLYKKITLHPNKDDIIEIPKIIATDIDENKINSNDEYSTLIEIENELIYPESNEILKNFKLYKLIKDINKIVNLSSSCLCKSFSCQYEFFVNVNFSGWISDEFGIFIPIILYPDENIFNYNYDNLIDEWEGKKMENINIKLKNSNENIIYTNKKLINNNVELNYSNNNDNSERELKHDIKIQEIELTDLNKYNYKDDEKENKKKNEEDIIKEEIKENINNIENEKKSENGMIKKEINSIEEQTIISEDSKNKNIGFKKEFNKDWIDDNIDDGDDEDN